MPISQAPARDVTAAAAPGRLFHVRSWNGALRVESDDQLAGGVFTSHEAARTFVRRFTVGDASPAVIEWTDGTREQVRFGKH